jgi:endonuclease/exonuclease/phosphatase (EEP) superfamily protein YafD
MTRPSAPPWLRAALRLAIALGGVAAALLAAASAAGQLHPQADMAAALAPTFLALSLAVTLAASLPPPQSLPRRLGLVLGICASLWFGGVVGSELAARGWLILTAPLERAAAADAPRLRIATFNVSFGRYAPARVPAGLLQLDSDILALQEFSDADAGRWRASLAAYPFRTPCVSSPYCNVQILSQRAPLQTNPLSQAYRDRLNLETQDAWIRMADAVFAVDPDRPELGTVHVVALHLRRDGTRGALPEHDLRLIEQTLTGVDPERLILLGDFNIPAGSYRLQRFERRTATRRLTHAVATWPTPSRPWRGLTFRGLFAIDHIYAGRAWGLTQTRRLPDMGSDHYGVETELILRRR